MGGIDNEHGAKEAGNDGQNIEQSDGRRRTMSAADGVTWKWWWWALVYNYPGDHRSYPEMEGGGAQMAGAEGGTT